MVQAEGLVRWVKVLQKAESGKLRAGIQHAPPPVESPGYGRRLHREKPDASASRLIGPTRILRFDKTPDSSGAVLNRRKLRKQRLRYLRFLLFRTVAAITPAPVTQLSRACPALPAGPVGENESAMRRTQSSPSLRSSFLCVVSYNRGYCSRGRLSP